MGRIDWRGDWWTGDETCTFIGIDTYAEDGLHGLADDPLGTISPSTSHARMGCALCFRVPHRRGMSVP